MAKTEAKDPYSDYCADKLRNINNYLTHPQLSASQRKDIENFYMEFCQDKARNMKVPTAEGYVRSVGLFGLWLGKDFDKASQDDLKKYIDTLEDRSNSVRDWAKLALKCFYRQLLTGKTGKHDPFPELVAWIKIGYKKMQVVKKEDVLDSEETKRLLHGCKTVRDRALISLLLDTGVRSGEAANIRIRDVHLSGDDPFIKLTHSKTETGLRDVFLVDSLHEIRAWMQLHPNKNKPDAFFFMPLRARGGEKPTPFMTVPSIHAVVVAAGKKAGLEKKVWTHLLRHVAATNVAVDGMSASMMNASFGWSDSGRMAGRYGHVSARDAAHFRKKAKGIEVKGTEKQAARICWRCNTTNAWHADFCATCSSALDKERAKEDKVSTAQKMEKVMERLARLEGKRGKDSSKNAKARAKEKLRALAATRKAKKG